MLDINPQKISFDLYEDIRDSYGTPYEIEGKSFESETIITINNYKILIAKHLLQHPKRLIYRISYEFIKIKLKESNLVYDTGEDTDLFTYLAGVYFGFGVILSINLKDQGFTNDGLWETKWIHFSDMPNEVMAFALATYASLIEQDNPKWKSDLPNDLKTLFEKAIVYLKEYPNSLVDENELLVHDLLDQADIEYQINDFDSAISTSEKILFLPGPYTRGGFTITACKPFLA